VWWPFWTAIKVIKGLNPDSNFLHALQIAANSQLDTYKIHDKINKHRKGLKI
jgi:hypothetical protein